MFDELRVVDNILQFDNIFKFLNKFDLITSCKYVIICNHRKRLFELIQLVVLIYNRIINLIQFIHENYTNMGEISAAYKN